MEFKSGFITILGRPNVGKSTLLNKLIGEKISIISDKPQTTRNKITMIYTDESMQIVFLDTPGVQMPKNALGEYMLKVSKSTLSEVDLITMIVDADGAFGKLDSYIIDELKGIDTPIILLINKIDLAEKDEVEKLKVLYKDLGIFNEVIAISALNDENLDSYIKIVREMLPPGPMYYPDDMITDQPERAIMAELIREKVLLNMSDEIPHGIAVEVEKVQKRDNKDLLDVHATIHVEKKSHKPMVIGKGGSMISKIGTEARVDIENLMDTKVNLQLWVKITKDWRRNEDRIKEFGYR